MKTKVTLTVLMAAVLIAAGCSKPATATAPKASTNSNASVAKAAEKKSLPLGKVVPVPANWIDMADEHKGYGFKVPEGTQSQTQNVEGVDLFLATTPKPSSVAVIVFAFKDKDASKDDLIKLAAKTLENMDEKDIKIGDLIELSDDYSVATISSVDAKGKITKGKVLVATDVTDNYVMLLGTPEAEYKENEKIIDEIWGSFTMRSGGYSGSS